MTERKTIDARGAFCPGPLMEMISSLKASAVGDEVELLSTDKGTAHDVPEWVALVGHEMVDIVDHGDHWSLIVRKTK